MAMARAAFMRLLGDERRPLEARQRIGLTITGRPNHIPVFNDLAVLEPEDVRYGVSRSPFFRNESCVQEYKVSLGSRP
jgi:hypothetical protein